MTTLSEAYMEGVDAVIADNGLNRAGFRDAMKLVLVSGASNSEINTWIDALAVEYQRLGIINNGTYNNLRGEIIAEGDVTSQALFDALAVSINALPESQPLLDAARLIDLRDERDEIDNAIDRCQALIDAEPAGTVGRLVKDILRDGKRLLREHKQGIRDQIQNLTGDPDS